MTARKAPAQKVGSMWDVPEGAVVVRPDGEAVTVTGGLYVLTQPGTYRCGDDQMEAK